MTVFIYVPFDDDDLKTGAGQFTMPDQQNDQAPVVVTHDAGADALGGLIKGDILYILAHGRYGSGSQIVGIIKGRLFGTRKVTMTATKLAEKLVGHKLPESFSDVRLLVCWGGYVGGDLKDGKHTLSRNEADAPFAGQLCSALKGNGFTNIRVTGYNGAITYAGKGHEKEFVTEVDSRLVKTRRRENIGAAMVVKEGTRLAGALTPTGSLSTNGRTVWY